VPPPPVLLPGAQPDCYREGPISTTGTLEGNLLEFSTAAVTLGLLIFGLSLVYVLRHRGGPELAFARLLADTRRRTLFLSALYMSLAALFGIGLASSVQAFVGGSAAEMNLIRTALFMVGAAGIFVLMIDALHTSPLTLEEGWNLKETAARVSNAPDPIPPPIAMDGTPYTSGRGPRRSGP
jgi:hypothetical protein